MKNKSNLSSILTLILFLLSILFLCLIVFVLTFSSLLDLFRGFNEASASMIMAFAFGFVCFIVIACTWFVLEKVRNKENAETKLNFPFSNWHILIGFAIIVIGILIGTMTSLIENTILNWLLLPTLTILVIVPPIWLMFGLGSHTLELGARWRFFSIFGISITLAPLIMIILEFIILFFGAVSIGVFISIVNPDLLQEFFELTQSVSNITDETVILALLAPYISNGYVIALGLSYIALIIPLIEELFKPLGVWLFGFQIDTPTQGFVLGMASGAAFALFESLNASADASMGWGAIVTARAGTSLLHIITSGIMGWGIVSAFKEKRYGRLIASYLVAVLIHDVWNATATGAGIAYAGEALGKPEWLYMYAPAFTIGLFILAIGMFIVLIKSNRKLRTPEILPQPQNISEEEL